MRDSEITPGPVPADVLAYFRAKKLKPSFAYQDVWLEEHEFSFSAAKVMRRDVLATLQQEIDRAIRLGLPFEQWLPQVEPRLREVGWWEPHSVVDPQTGKVAKVDPPSRIKLIFDTNVRMAHATAQYERILRNRRYRPYMLYVHGNSANPRKEHLAWHGVLLPIEDDFWSYAYPPGGWGCSCSVRSVSSREADRLEEEGVPHPVPEHEVDDDGNPTGHVKDRRIPVQRTAPKVVRKPWLNKRTGDIEMIPVGIDPGFHHLPRANRERALAGAAE